MILRGSIDDKNQLWVPITVAGEHGQQKVSALLDTGFTGELQLPLQIAVPLGLKLVGVARYKLADGSISNQMIFFCFYKLGHKNAVSNCKCCYRRRRCFNGRRSFAWLRFSSRFSAKTACY